jgi:hypothetical protein
VERFVLLGERGVEALRNYFMKMQGKKKLRSLLLCDLRGLRMLFDKRVLGRRMHEYDHI